MTATQFVLETLTHRKIERVNFRYGPIRVYPAGYNRDVAKLVRDGHIQFTTQAGAHYTADHRPGERHTMALPAQDFKHHLAEGTLTVRGTPSPLLRGTVVHEATHALQDYQRNHTDPAMSEGAAYLAGWITNLLWGYPELATAPDRPTGHSCARELAGRFVHGHVGYVIPDADVQTLNGLVAIGSPHRYVFNGI